MNKTLIYRLLPNEDLKQRIIELAKTNKISAGCIINAVGSLKKATLRTVVTNNIPQIKVLTEELEIVSVIGTIGKNGSHVHIHISCSNKNGEVFGGHLMPGCIVKTTVELIILGFPEYSFLTKDDPATGFKELDIKLN